MKQTHRNKNQMKDSYVSERIFKSLQLELNEHLVHCDEKIKFLYNPQDLEEWAILSPVLNSRLECGYRNKK